MKFTISTFCLLVASFAVAQDCCKGKVEAKQDKSGYTSGAKTCGTKPMSAEEEFLMEAEKMAMVADGKMACCKSTSTHAVVKGEAGCCGAPGEPAKFKVYVGGKGYQFFGCAESAGKGRQALIAKGAKVGQIQKVNSKSARMG